MKKIANLFIGEMGRLDFLIGVYVISFIPVLVSILLINLLSGDILIFYKSYIAPIVAVLVFGFAILLNTGCAIRRGRSMNWGKTKTLITFAFGWIIALPMLLFLFIKPANEIKDNRSILRRILNI